MNAFRVMGLLCPKTELKHILYLVIFLLVGHFTLGQPPKKMAPIKALKIGTELPSGVWTTSLPAVNYPGGNTITLEKEKTKLLLLDFWATWCSSCLANFPKMESLQKQFGDKIKILAVTKEDHSLLTQFFSSKNGKRYNTVISLTGDKMFHDWFPHTGVPYIVWIYRGKVINTTDVEQVTPAAIEEILSNKESSLQTVIQQDPEKPLMLSENFDLERGAKLLSYSFFSKGRLRSAYYGSHMFREGHTVYGRQFSNRPILRIYEAISYEIFQQYQDRYSRKRLINQVKDPSKIDFYMENLNLTQESNLYSYSYIVPLSLANSLYSNMLKNLNQYSDYNATIEKQLTKCLILTRTSVKDNIATKGGDRKSEISDTTYYARNIPVKYLITVLNERLTNPLPVIDETGYLGNMDINLTDITDLTNIKKQLVKYGLDLTQAPRLLYMLTLKDK